VATGSATPGRRTPLDLAHGLELLGVDDRALPGQRHGAAGVAGAAAARHDGQAEFDAAGHQAAISASLSGVSTTKGILDAPVGGVGDVRHARQAVELEVVLGGVAAEHAARALRSFPHGAKCAAKRCTALLAAFSSSPTRASRWASSCGVRRLLDLAQAVVQGVDQQAAGAWGSSRSSSR
jgi:hypothetical protein